MKRYALQNLVAWKNSKNRKPLLLYGARQVGKTWLMEEFGKTNFSDYVAINVEKNERIANVFNNTLNPQEIVTAIEMEARKKVTKDTLIIKDIFCASNAVEWLQTTRKTGKNSKKDITVCVVAYTPIVKQEILIKLNANIRLIQL